MAGYSANKGFKYLYDGDFHCYKDFWLVLLWSLEVDANLAHQSLS